MDKDDPTYKEVEQQLYEILLNRKLIYKSIRPGNPGYWNKHKVKDDGARDD
tara:strand:- start:718 stop:870 length:153 start_codon:yes stop_codon:yes gene_type:complete